MAQPFVFAASADVGMTEKQEPPDKGDGATKHCDETKKISFRDMVMGKKEVVQTRPKVDLIKEKLAKIEYEDGNPLKLMVHIAASVLEGLSAPWKDALVISLLGKSIGYKTLKERLLRLWRLMADFEIMDIGNRFFKVKFDNENDRQKVMEEGPWMIFDHYLTVQCWTLEFLSPTVKIERTMI